MRLFYLLSGMILTASICAEADTNQKAPTYLMPGAELRIDNLKSINANLQRHAADKNNAPAAKHDSAPIARIAGTALDASVAGTRTVDTILVTSYDEIYTDGNSNESVQNLATIKYDDHGYRTVMTSQDRTVRYTYTTDDKGRWLSRKIEVKEYESGDWFINSLEERTIENDYVTSMTIYGKNPSEETVKQHYYEFEYRDGSTAYTPSVEILGAAITKEIGYDEDGEISSETRYTWIDAAKDYFETYSFEKGFRRLESELGKDRLTTRTYIINYNTQAEQLENEVITFFGDKVGSYTRYYDDNGNVYDENSTIHEEYREASGDSIIINYNYVEGNLVPTQKTIYSRDMTEPDVDYTKDFDRSYSLYHYDGNGWKLTHTESVKNHVLSNGLCELTVYGYGGERIETVKAELIKGDYGSEYWELYPAVIDKDQSYYIVKEMSENYGPTYYLYEYYTAAGALQKTIRQTTNNLYGEYEFSIRAAGESEWKALDEFTLNYDEDGAKFREVYKTGSNGKPESITEYITTPRYNNGNEFKMSEKLFSYGANGDDFTISTYEVLNPNDLSKLYLSEKLEQNTLADGTIERIEWSYAENGSGKVDEAYRTTVKNNVKTYYSYKKADGSWQKTSADALNDLYFTADGVEVQISRTLSDDESYAINLSKYESKAYLDENEKEHRMSANYSWDRENECWVGEYKREEVEYSYGFHAISSNDFNPISLYNDEYVMVPADNFSYIGEIQETNVTSYSWNIRKKDWEVSTSQNIKAEINGNQAKITKNEYECNVWSDEIKDKTIVQTIERDNEYRMTLQETVETETTYRQDSEPETRKSHVKEVNTYNDENGMLAEHKIYYFDEDNTRCYTYRYTYDKFTITTAGIEDIVADSDESIAVVGQTVTATGKTITVYNLSGAIVASGNDSVKLPETQGLYLVKAGSKTVKVAVK